jgi:hypothetical protein
MGEHRPEHQRARDLLWPLVDGAGGEDVARAERAQQQAAVEHAREVVDGRIADVHGDRVATVTLDDRRQPARDLGERLVPGGRAQLTVAADQRRAQAVGVVVQVAERGSLGADEPAAEDVVPVAADPRHRAVADRELQAACGFAQRTGPEDGRLRRWGHVSPPRRLLRAGLDLRCTTCPRPLRAGIPGLGRRHPRAPGPGCRGRSRRLDR